MTWPACCVCGEDITETMLAENNSDRAWHPTCVPVAAKPEPPPAVEAVPLPEWVRTLINPLPRRLAILEAFQARGVAFRVCEGTLQYRDTERVLSEGESLWITENAEGLREALLKQERLCTKCGMEGAHWDADWCNECIRVAGWEHYQRLMSKQGKAAKKEKLAESTAVISEERRTKSLWD